MTSFSAAQHWHGYTNQPLRQREWWNAILSSSFSPTPSLYHSHTVSLSLVPLCHFSCTLSPIFSSHTHSLNLKHFVSPMLAFSPIHFPLLSVFKALSSISSAFFVRHRNYKYGDIKNEYFVFEWIMMWWKHFTIKGAIQIRPHVTFLSTQTLACGVQYITSSLLCDIQHWTAVTLKKKQKNK